MRICLRTSSGTDLPILVLHPSLERFGKENVSCSSTLWVLSFVRSAPKPLADNQ
jgi:hypothetical protein